MRPKLLNIFMFFFLICFSNQSIKAQTYHIQRSVYSNSGGTYTFSTNGKKYFVQQTIGQKGNIGTKKNNEILIRQGFIQPKEIFTIKNKALNALKFSVYPNPFQSEINLSFSEEIDSIIYIRIVSSTGVLIYRNSIYGNRFINIDLNKIPDGIYVMVISTNNSICNKVIIKQNHF